VAILAALCTAIETRDPYSQGHSSRVTALAEKVAAALGWTADRRAELRVGSRLHDLGKLAVPDSVLLKRGGLTDRELAQMRIHPEAGARILEAVGSFDSALPCLLYHHERWDGYGYPKRLAGLDIPIEARILAVVDAFDAMTSDRAYRRAMPAEDALEEIDRCAGSQFDPELAEIFLACWDREEPRTRLAV
jgi:HD-GYP domain-containing protein (c-di-GMP phosphodiesterase class II)